MDNLEVLEQKLMIETKHRDIEYPNYKKMLCSVVGTFGFSLFFSWLSSNKESHLFTINVFGVPIFYFLLAILPTVVLITFIVYITCYYKSYKKNIKFEFYTSKVFYTNIFGLFVLNKLRIDNIKNDISLMYKQIENIDEKEIESLLVDKTDLLNFLINLYNEYTDLSADFFQNLSQYCLLLAVNEGYVYYNDGNYSLNKLLIRECMYRASFIITDSID